MTLYNEIDRHCLARLPINMQRGLIAEGRIDDRSIEDFRPGDVRGDEQAHFFAGLGIWSHALRMAGVPDTAPVWTGSCPCQPFSIAGRRRGASDARHLWPAWFALIRECRPAVVFGEQTSSSDGRLWLDAVSVDLEGLGYAVAAADLCAAGVGAPHQRHRLYWVAYAGGDECPERWAGGADGTREVESTGRGDAGVLAGANRERFEEFGLRIQRGGSLEEGPEAAGGGEAGHLVNARSSRSGRHRGSVPRAEAQGGQSGSEVGRVADLPESTGATRGFWSGCDWVLCRPERPGKPWTYKPVEPGTFPLASRARSRVGRLRAYGNSIVPQVAAAFVASALDAIGEQG